jgi:hypothetical protein
MTTGKIIALLAIMLFAAGEGFSQNREELAFPADPVKSIQLYPNPTTDYLNIKFETPCANKIKLAIHNIIGNTMDVETEVLNENEIQIKVRELPAGYYLLSIRDSETNLKNTFKFLKR